MLKQPNRYTQIIEKIFFDRYKEGDTEVVFKRSDIEDTAKALGIILLKNIGDTIYSFRFRVHMPEKILAKAKEGYTWVIRIGESTIFNCFSALSGDRPQFHDSGYKNS